MVIILTGNSLSKRQQELNEKVREALRNNVNFDEVKAEEEKSDVDVLFKIDLASEYKRIDYMVEILKSGDSLYISRVLKSIWIYDDEHSGIMNTDYLHHDVFPLMSLKMKKKTLTSISIYVTNRDRAISFFNYCATIKMNNIALKFLLSTPETFKTDFILNKMENSKIKIDQESDYLLNLIGSSFNIAEAYLQKTYKYNISTILLKIRYLYSISGEKYLDLLEKYSNLESINKKARLGLRVSTNIIKKHKNRVLKNAMLFVNILNKSVLTKHIEIDDAKDLICSLAPLNVKKFWDSNFCLDYDFIIKKIPINERFNFVKQMFANKYFNEPFEMTRIFYDLEYHELLMSENEKEIWALRHLASQEEMLGIGKDFMWYKFVTFQKSFIGIKNYIKVTQDKNERSQMINILAESPKNQDELTCVLNYYYERHVNEAPHHKCEFLDIICERHNIFGFGNDCWTAYNKLLHSIGVYDRSKDCNSDYRIQALFYHVIHNQQIPNDLPSVFDSYISVYSVQSQIAKLKKEEVEKLYQFMLQYYVDKIKSIDGETNSHDENFKNKLRKYLKNTCNLLKCFKKEADGLPDFIIKLVKLDWDEYKYESIFCNMETTKTITQDDLVRLLKQDANLVVTNLTSIKDLLDKSYRLTFNQLLKKIRIYFFNDVAKEYLNFFLNSVSGPDMTLPAVDALTNVIFQLADKDFRINYMLKYVPTNPKIDHMKIDRHLLHTQEAICRFAYMSRPPVPLENIIMYLKGDYVHYCLPMFNYLLSNLPPSLCLQFVETVLNSPLSIQKHGLRMAFKSFTSESLKQLVLAVWKKTKSVSLRYIIYTQLCDKIIHAGTDEQKYLFEALKFFNLDLNEYDKEIFSVLTNHNMPCNLRGDFLESAWKSVGNLPQKPANWERQAKLINNIENNIKFIKQDVVAAIVEEHVRIMLNEKQIRPTYNKDEMKMLNKAKWQIVAKYIVYFEEKDKLNKSKDLVQRIFKAVFEMWDDVHDDTYTLRQFSCRFIIQLEDKSEWKDYKLVNDVFVTILKAFEHNIRMKEIYLMIWRLKLKMIERNIIYDAKANNYNADKIGHSFANEFVCLIKEYLEKQLYYSPFANEIYALMNQNILSASYHFDDLSDEVLHVAVAQNLISFNNREAYLLALNILPTDCPENCDEAYKNVMDIIKKNASEEVQSVMHEKFVNSGFKRRRYV